MATKIQIIRMHNQLCKSSILPPFRRTGDNDQGHDDFGPNGAEFWLDSQQIFAGGDQHCNMQRIISMNPDHFSNHLLYHLLNNKQKQVDQEDAVRVNNLFGQFNHIQKTAEKGKAALQTS